jgi:hypothetical protein
MVGKPKHTLKSTVEGYEGSWRGITASASRMRIAKTAQEQLSEA